MKEQIWERPKAWEKLSGTILNPENVGEVVNVVSLPFKLTDDQVKRAFDATRQGRL